MAKAANRIYVGPVQLKCGNVEQIACGCITGGGS